jgi:hypothetical protein
MPCCMLHAMMAALDCECLPSCEAFRVRFTLTLRLVCLSCCVLHAVCCVVAPCGVLL